MRKIFSIFTILCLYSILGIAQPFNTIGEVSDGYTAGVPRAVATLTDGAYQLTEDAIHHTGAVWNRKKIDLACNFTLTASMYFGINNAIINHSNPSPQRGADGIGFLLQPKDELLLGSRGGGMGFFGISPSFITEFDTYDNTQDGNPDPPYDHIAFSKNGSDHHLLESNPLAPTNITYDIEDGAYHTVVFTWNAATKTFTVKFDDRITKSIVIDLRNDLFSCNRYVYAGFTAATGWFKNEHRVKDIVLTQAPCIPLPSVCDPLTAIASKVDATCKGGVGSATLTVTSGPGPYSYSLNGGPSVPFTSPFVINGLLAGNYSIVVSNGAVSTAPILFNIAEPATSVLLSVTNKTVACNGNNGTATVLASGGTPPYMYSKDGITYVASGTFTGLAPGAITFYAKDANGCIANVPTTILNCPPPEVCDYNVYAFKEAKFYDNNSFDANVGVRNSDGKAEFKKNTILTPGFVKAAEIKVESPSNVPNRIIGPAILTLPTLDLYAGSPDGYSNLDISDNTGTMAVPVTYAGNYKDVKIGKNSFVKLTGTDFKKIEINEGSKVEFTKATIDIKELKLNGKNSAITKICFTNNTGCTNVRIGYKVEFNEFSEVNRGLVGASPVTFYLATIDAKDIDFTVKKGSFINASVYSPNGTIKPEGSDDAITTMCGIYIAEKVDAGKFVTWKKGVCCFSVTPPVVTPPCVDGFVSPDPAKKNIVFGNYTITDNGTTVTIRTTLAKSFVDNSYGTNVVNWGSRSHSFGNLTGSDKLQLALFNAGGTKSMEFVMDYISSSSAPSGFSTLGVSGGEGNMLTGSASDVVDVKTSISENLKLPVFQSGFTTNSPATTSNTSYTVVNPAHSAWIFETWYEVTVNKSAFGTAGFGYPMVSSMHASPSKTGNNSEVVVPCVPPVVTPPCIDGFISPDPAKKNIVFGNYTITDNGVAGTVTIRTTLAKSFVDNSYGSNIVNWGSRSHSFGNLTGSDKLQLALHNAGGTKSMEFVMDYISSSSATSGFSTLGVSGGEGQMLVGLASDVVSVKTSISENLNTLGFGSGFTSNSPATISNTSYTVVNPAHNAWIFDVWYEVTVKKSAFAGGFGYPMVSSMHASPSKTGNKSEDVVPCVKPRAINNDLVLGLEEQVDLKVRVAPNPTNAYFQLKLQSSNQEKVIVRIMDAFGRPVKVLNNVQSNTTLVIGDDLKPGNYFAEIIQGNERKVVKLIKM